MDNVTHTLTGLALARAGLGRLDPRAMWVTLVAANLPDADIVTGLAGSHVYLDYHRGWTHSFAYAPIVALAAVAIVRAIGRKPLAWLRGSIAGLIGVLSHIGLDLTNVYGTRALEPFSHAYLRLDWAAVIDPWILIALAVGASAPLLSRLVGSEIGESRKRQSTGAGWAWFALVFMTLYLGGRGVLHERALATLEARMYESESPRAVAAFPDPFAPWRWRGLVDTGEAMWTQRVDLMQPYDPTAGERYGRPAPDPLFAKAAEAPPVAAFVRFAGFAWWRRVSDRRVELTDWRFGTPEEPGFLAVAEFDDAGRVERSWFTFGSPEPR